MPKITDATAFASARRLARRIRQGKFGSRDLLEHYLERIERWNPAVNAVVHIDAGRARLAADRADQEAREGRYRGQLHGLPITVKDAIDVADMCSTWGLPERVGIVATQDAEVVRRVRAAGAVVFGKTNVPTGLADWQTDNPIFGRCNNPHALDRSPGGSSGGAAAAVAAGFTAFEIGSDIGGSIRNPAHYCGVCGLKPSYGIVPQDGHGTVRSHPAQDLNVLGPLSRHAEDLDLLLGIIAGPTAGERMAWQLSLPSPRLSSLDGMRAAILPRYVGPLVDEAIDAAIAHLGGTLQRYGAFLATGAAPAINFDEVHALYLSLLRGATSVGLSDQAFEAALVRARGYEADDKGYRALSDRGVARSHRDWLRLGASRHAVAAAWARFFEDFDCLLCPVAATPAFPHDLERPREERLIDVNGTPQDYNAQLFWAGLASVPGLPAAVVPIGRDAEGRPIGMQIIGPLYSDRSVARIARLIEEKTRAFEPPNLSNG
ncbi:amidase [Mesorhizobium sp. VK4C]|uniref:amidase n=1 Tax=Mesorhizobium captivum TaxID=3072319 RepID=UPI002A240C85|nr:amidase [Mesorhizobium sp. VK4C]MDX8500683.1 amidase [Mesorhizobium sp. VK4C]